MGEDEVDATSMDVERFAEILHGHRRAFEMPTGTSASEGRIPRRPGFLILVLGRFP
jgi:hypothetical protein